jgi:hypothetical protein
LRCLSALWAPDGLAKVADHWLSEILQLFILKVWQLRYTIGDLHAKRFGRHRFGPRVQVRKAPDEPPGDVKTDKITVDKFAAFILDVLDDFQDYKAINMDRQRALAGRIIG